MQNIKRVFLKFKIIFFILSLFIAIFIFSEEISQGFKKGFLLCLNVLIPSLFPFMILSTFISIFSFSKRFDKICNLVTKFLFGLPGYTALTIFLGLIGGYPTGALGISDLLKNELITENQAKRMSLFLVNSGPAFVITAVGLKMLHNFEIGIVLFLSQTLSAIILGLISKYTFKERGQKSNNFKIKGQLNFSDSFVKSVKSSSQSIFNMCSFVVLFSAFMEIIRSKMILNYIMKTLKILKIKQEIGLSSIISFFEITSGCYTACELKVPLWIISFFLSFGGLCVHMQIFSCLEGLSFSKKLFFLFRVLHGMISILIFYLLLPFFNCSLQTFNTYFKGNLTCDFSSSHMEIIFLSLCFLISLTKDSINFMKKE